jgi:hypothetical protein
MKTLLFLLATTAWAVEPGFEPIFDGKTLDGWSQALNRSSTARRSTAGNTMGTGLSSTARSPG